MTRTSSKGASYSGNRYNRRPRKTLAADKKEGSNNGRKAGTTSKSKRSIVHRRRRQKHNQLRSNNASRPKSFERVVSVSGSSIHSEWKRKLGGLIRWYANLPIIKESKSKEMVDRDIERMYTTSFCDMTETKEKLINAIIQESGKNHPNTETTQKSEDSSWLDLEMVVESNSGSNKNGVLLEKEERSGEGPAHSAEKWNVVKVPDWAIGRAFHLRVNNSSPVDLSCEMTIDGHKVAKNAPIQRNSIRSIHPDKRRYFESHKWVIQPCSRISLAELQQQKQNHQQQNKPSLLNRQIPPQPNNRNNRVRPNYEGNRVSIQDFPDPTAYGWMFTGSNQNSRVEFFEKNLNYGKVKMDFYYTTATVKTVLYHPTTGMNQLFRRCIATPDVFLEILNNPRYHSRLGYRKSDQARNIGESTATESSMETDMSKEQGSPVNEAVPMDQPDETIFFAANDDYDFEKEGHTNRKIALKNLIPSEDFKAWRDAASQDWACIHAKFYVSLPRRIRSNDKVFKAKRKRSKQPLPLPEMVKVADIKAAEHATLSTKFSSVGPAEPKRWSNIRMERVKGGNQQELGTEPVFEYKLYYRAESSSVEEESDAGDHMNDDSEGEEDEISLIERIREETPLPVYKQEKLLQLEEWFQENKAVDRSEADVVRTEAQRGISNAHDTHSVDKIIQSYWEWHQKQEWNAS